MIYQLALTTAGCSLRGKGDRKVKAKLVTTDIVSISIHKR